MCSTSVCARRSTFRSRDRGWTSFAPSPRRFEQKVAQVANTIDVRVKQGKNYPELHVNVDRTKAAYYGITQDRVIVDVITGISSNLALSPNYWLDPKTANGYFLLAQYPEQSLTKTEDLLNIPIIGARTPLGPTVHAGHRRHQRLDRGATEHTLCRTQYGSLQRLLCFRR